jgi:hypothetical protein
MVEAAPSTLAAHKQECLCHGEETYCDPPSPRPPDTSFRDAKDALADFRCGYCEAAIEVLAEAAVDDDPPTLGLCRTWPGAVLAAGAAVEAEGPGGVRGFGAETPAMSEPKPSFWRLKASSLPVESRPFADWNFCMAATVFVSHLPFGSPW